MRRFLKKPSDAWELRSFITPALLFVFMYFLLKEMFLSEQIAITVTLALGVLSILLGQTSRPSDNIDSNR